MLPQCKQGLPVTSQSARLRRSVWSVLMIANTPLNSDAKAKFWNAFQRSQPLSIRESAVNWACTQFPTGMCDRYLDRRPSTRRIPVQMPHDHRPGEIQTCRMITDQVKSRHAVFQEQVPEAPLKLIELGSPDPMILNQKPRNKNGHLVMGHLRYVARAYASLSESSST
jgi:hypothetical protein